MKMSLICCRDNSSHSTIKVVFTLPFLLSWRQWEIYLRDYISVKIYYKAELKHALTHTLVVQVLKCFWMHLLFLNIWTHLCHDHEVDHLLFPVVFTHKSWSVWLLNAPEEKMSIGLPILQAGPLTTALMSSTVDVILACQSVPTVPLVRFLLSCMWLQEMCTEKLW